MDRHGAWGRTSKASWFGPTLKLWSFWSSFKRGDLSNRYQRLLAHVFDKAQRWRGVSMEVNPLEISMVSVKLFDWRAACAFKHLLIQCFFFHVFPIPRNGRIHSYSRFPPIVSWGLCGRACDTTCVHHSRWSRLRDAAIEIMAIAI